MATHSSILAWKIPWTRSLVVCSPWSCKESDMTEQPSTHTHTRYPYLEIKSVLGLPHSLPIVIILLSFSSLPSISQKSCINILSSLSDSHLLTVYSFMALAVLPKSVDFFHYASHFSSHTVNVQKKVKHSVIFIPIAIHSLGFFSVIFDSFVFSVNA